MKTKPCGTCENVIQESIDQMEARDRRKEGVDLDDIYVPDIDDAQDFELDTYHNQGYNDTDYGT